MGARLGAAPTRAVDRAAALLRASPCRAPAVGRCGRLQVQRWEQPGQRRLAEGAMYGPWVAAEVCLGRHSNDALEIERLAAPGWVLAAAVFADCLAVALGP